MGAKVTVGDINEFLDLVRLLSQKGNVYIAGAGKYGKQIGRFLNENEICWSGYVDKNLEITQINGKKVYPYELAFTEKDFFLISSFGQADGIREELKRVNILDTNIIEISDILDIIYGIYESFESYSIYTKRIQKFRNCYYGKRCFIIGNGPSLEIADLDMLKNEITFACNSIYVLYKRTSWRPTFYCAWDSTFCDEVMAKKKDLINLIAEYEAAFISVMSKGFKYRDDEDIHNLFYIKGQYKENQETGLPLFSNDCSQVVYASGTVSYAMLQLAIYMGFQEIYLLGIDCSYSVEKHSDGSITHNDVLNHQELIEEVDEHYNASIIDKFGALAYIDKQIAGYKAARKYAENYGVKIYNATRGGKLEVFERVDFDKIIFGK